MSEILKRFSSIGKLEAALAQINAERDSICIICQAGDDPVAAVKALWETNRIRGENFIEAQQRAEAAEAHVVRLQRAAEQAILDLTFANQIIGDSRETLGERVNEVAGRLAAALPPTAQEPT